MKFSGILLDEGIRLLERSYLPACQKTGKKLHMLLTSQEIYFVQDEHEAHGMHVSVRIETGILFDDPFVCKSKANDIICIRTSIDVLLKALRGASSHEANNVKLALRHRPLRTSLTGIAIPLLELSWKNDSITLSQEIPIEKPSPSVEMLRVKSLCSMAATSRFYADIFPEAKAMIVRRYVSIGNDRRLDDLKVFFSSQGILDQVKCFSDQVNVLLTLNGDLHLVARANNSTIGVAFPSFEVFLKDGSAQKLQVEYVL